jgi:hypothetical protein
MSEPTNHELIDSLWRKASTDAELIGHAREQIERSLKLLRQPMPSTFVGEQRLPPDPSR